jgi:hypothetical protein
MTRTMIPAVALLAFAAPAIAVPTTWSIDQPWEFYTSNTPAGTDLTNLVGTITWDRDVSNYYPSEWSFTLVHFDPAFTPHYPVIIEGTYPNLSDAPGLSWDFRRDVFAQIRLTFAPGMIDVLLDGTQDSVAFTASEYTQFGPISSQRGIFNGTMTLVPTPGAAALMGLAGLTAIRRKR